ncbi:MAG: decarboxylating 6-phosphogluconate dehydrogenase [Candidatus Dependentiae bacterium]|nr:decarboxylating 6-phosphogluconate dehydrogenase [Candidatus Dependentiae bacterium]
MKMGIIGLGRMGSAVAFRLVQAGHEVVGFDPDSNARKVVADFGAEVVDNLAHMVARTQIVWLMVPEGKITEMAFNELLHHMSAGAIIIDGGNSQYQDSMNRAQIAAQKGISFLDCGTSGGVRGRDTGFCLMVGGNKDAYEQVCPLLEAIAAPEGFSLVGPSGVGHYVKMVHNGIEYALLQAYAEGFHIIREGSFKDADIDLQELSRLWNVSSIVRSFILELTHDIFKHDYVLDNVSGEIAESGMGLWTVQEATKHAIPVTMINESLRIRARSRETGGTYATKVVALLRNKFGGHAFNTINKDNTSKE